MKYVIISNRLPITAVDKGGKPRFVRSGGGLATGLGSLAADAAMHWIGWPGLHVDGEERQQEVRTKLYKRRLHPVFLDRELIQDYYQGYSNSTLWPLCHYFLSYVDSDERYWTAYRRVNEIFCEEALKIIEPGDLVWIHDYHLMLLPGMLRNAMPDAAIGYFHHIPFPAYELFRCLPEREDILRGLLGADLIGFHVHDYMRHFIDAAYRALHLVCRMDEVQIDNRVARIEAFPMGINYDLYHEAAALPRVTAFIEKFRRTVGEGKVILSVDRLDYSKGMLLRLESFAAFLEHNPEYRGKVTLLMVVAPSRDSVGTYADLKSMIDKKVGAINGAYATMGWIPVHYFYRSFSFAELAALYNVADIALVTPLRDGMNLVAKEYLAAQTDSPGVLILSEMAGAAVELADAIIVNPADKKDMERAILKALAMSEEEQSAALRKMQRRIKRHTVQRWADDFLDELREAKKRNEDLDAKIVGKENLRALAADYAKAEKRLLMLDYDGTLAPFGEDPDKVFPSPALLELLASLAADPRNTVRVCSGRSKETLEAWLGALPIGLSAEHGVFFREKGVWHGECPDMSWKDEILGILERFTDKTPRAKIEEKTTALVWHYRQVDPWFALLRVNQLTHALIPPCGRAGLQIMRGNKIVEIKPAGFNKGTEARRLLEKGPYDFILAMGDDVTDEDMFAALPPESVTVKVGQFSDSARYAIPAQSRVHAFLAALATAV